MTWSSSHSQSQTLAENAHEALRRGDATEARLLFERAASTEVAAFEEIPEGKPRTLGIVAVSAAALLYKSGELEAAELFAHRAHIRSDLPAFARDQLRELLQAIWNERTRIEAGLSFAPGQVDVSVRGGEVVLGGAPLELILSKVQAIQSLFYRTAEFLKDVPLRMKGPPSKNLHDLFRPWLFQSVPGSYQFAVAVQQPKQQDLFGSEEPEPEVLTETFLSILRAASEDPVEGLAEIVPDAGYRQTFLKMARNLAPTGKGFDTLEIRGSGEQKSVLLTPGSRKIIGETLRPPPADASEVANEVILHGTLRALDLDRDWLEVAIDGDHRRVTGLSEAVDDLIGPMVNQDVVVRAKPGKGGKLAFIDIELDD